jgi:hypothetical protein
MNEWKPIESAPKDGTFFLAFDGEQFEVLNDPPGCFMGVWNLTNRGWRGNSQTCTTPTHWMPLSKAPS